MRPVLCLWFKADTEDGAAEVARWIVHDIISEDELTEGFWEVAEHRQAAGDLALEQLAECGLTVVEQLKSYAVSAEDVAADEAASRCFDEAVEDGTAIVIFLTDP